MQSKKIFNWFSNFKEKSTEEQISNFINFSLFLYLSYYGVSYLAKFFFISNN